MEMKKSAKLSDKTPSAFTGGAPARPVTGPGAARTRPSGRGGVAAAKARGISDKQASTVATMQKVMSKLNTELQNTSKAEKALQAITPEGGQAPQNYQSAKAISDEARWWGQTGRGSLTHADGIWGPNTKKALARIKQFIADTKIQGVLIQEGEGERPYGEMDDAAIIKMADDNIVNLGRLFDELGMDVPVAAKGRGGSGFILDQVPRQLSPESAIARDPWPAHWGEVPVTVGDLRGLDRFFLFLQGLTYTACKPLEGGDLDVVERGRKEKKPRERDIGYADDGEIQQLAEEILSSSIWKFAVPTGQLDINDAEPETKPAEPATETKPETKPAEKKPDAAGPGSEDIVNPWAEEKPSEGVICFYTIDDMFKWFYNRARVVYGQLNTLSQESAPHPVRKGPGGTPVGISDQDLRAANAYQAAIAKLWKSWGRIKRRVLGMIRDPKHPVVTIEMIMEAGAGELGGLEPGGPGAGRSRPGAGGGGITIPGGGESYEDRALKGPIREFMPMEWLLANDDFRGDNTEAEDAVKEMSAGGRLPDLNRRTWRGGDWVTIATNNIRGDTDTERISDFPVWAAKVRDLIREVYVNWEGMYRNRLDPGVIAQQNREWALWSSVIRRLINRANRNMDREIANAERSRPDQSAYIRSQRGRERFPKRR